MNRSALARIPRAIGAIPRWARWSIAAGILAALLLALDPAATASQLSGVRWALAAPAVAGLIAVQLIGAFTWRRLTRRLPGDEIPAGFAARRYYAAQAAGLVTPANLGADAYRARVALPFAGGWQRALAPVALHRVGNYVSLAFLGLAASFMVPLDGAPRTAVMVAAAVAVMLVLVAWWLSLSRRDPVIGETLDRHTLAGVEAVSLGLLFHLCSAACMVLIVRAVTDDGGLATVAASVVIARVTTLVPLTPGGIGVHEAALAALLAGTGVEPEAALAAGAVARLSLLATAGLGAAVLLHEHLLRRTPPLSAAPAIQDLA